MFNLFFLVKDMLPLEECTKKESCIRAEVSPLASTLENHNNWNWSFITRPAVQNDEEGSFQSFQPKKGLRCPRRSARLPPWSKDFVAECDEAKELYSETMSMQKKSAGMQAGA